MPSRLRRQKSIRKEWVRWICTSMSNKLSSDTDRMLSTNRLLPQGSLKRSCIRRLFKGWIYESLHCGRVITRRLASDVVRRLRKKFGLGVEDLDQEEIGRMHHLLKTARKRQLGKPNSAKAMSGMDCCETMPMELFADSWRKK